MFGLKGKSKAPDRGALMAAIVVRNKLVRAEPIAAGVRLKAPLKDSKLRAWLARGESRSEKIFELDALGAFTWECIDGRRTVEAIVRRFAEEKKVNLREAEVAVVEFLRMLVRRNLVGLVVATNAHKKR